MKKIIAKYFTKNDHTTTLDIIIHSAIVLFALFAVCYVFVVRFNLFSVREQSPTILIDQQGGVPQGKVVGVFDHSILISFEEGVTGNVRADLIKKYGLKERGYIPALDVRRYQVPTTESPLAIATLLSTEKGVVVFAEPDYLLEPSVVPNDPWFASWQQNKKQINASGAWDLSVGSPSEIVAVLDTGVACDHEDLRGVCVEGWNVISQSSDVSDVHGHGTMVAGAIAGIGNNSVGVAGTLWQGSLMPIRVSDTSGMASYSALASGITYAADKGVRVVNASYQVGGSSAVAKAASYLFNKGGLLITSAGNYGTLSGYRDSDSIITVGAVDTVNVRYSWSSYGSDVDVVAPGCTGATTARSGGYTSFCGTSLSAPEVAGVVALMWTTNKALTPSDIRTVLFSSVRDLGKEGRDSEYGWGLIDMQQAVVKAITYVPGTASGSQQEGKGGQGEQKGGGKKN